MKKIAIVFLWCFIVMGARAQHEHKVAPVDTVKKSISQVVHTEIGNAHIMIHYTAPAVRGRVIWGGLVPYGEVWVTGAHRATVWEFNTDIEVNKTVIRAGKYGVFTIPEKEKWIFIVNKKWDQHLADEYDAKDDVVRMEVIPTALKETKERLQYTLDEETDNCGVLTISWERIKVSIPFQVR
jgi:hypothetical protein